MNNLKVEADFNNFWKPILIEHGVDPKAVPEYIKVLLHEYYFLQRQALPVYNAVTNGEMNALSHCSGPIIEKFKKFYQPKPRVTQIIEEVLQNPQNIKK